MLHREAGWYSSKSVCLAFGRAGFYSIVESGQQIRSDQKLVFTASLLYVKH